MPHLEDELIQRLVRDEATGQLVPEPRTPVPASPAFKPNPRRGVSDLINKLLARPPQGPGEALFNGLGVMGLAPAAGIEALLNKFKPRVTGQDVNLPIERNLDPRLIR